MAGATGSKRRASLSRNNPAGLQHPPPFPLGPGRIDPISCSRDGHVTQTWPIRACTVLPGSRD